LKFHCDNCHNDFELNMTSEQIRLDLNNIVVCPKCHAPIHIREPKLKNEEIYKLALEKWGYETQRNIWVEEMAELIQALMKFDRKFNPSSEADIIKEIVDVTLCLEQMVIYFSDGSNIEERFKVAFERFTKLVLEDIDNREEVPA